MNFENLLVEKLEYKNLKLYVYCKIFYSKGEESTKILEFENIKKFTYLHSTNSFNFLDEFGELKKEIGNKFFTKIFYRSKQKKKLYIFDQLESFAVIEFNEDKEWNYRKQKEKA